MLRRSTYAGHDCRRGAGMEWEISTLFPRCLDPSNLRALLRYGEPGFAVGGAAFCIATRTGRPKQSAWATRSTRSCAATRRAQERALRLPPGGRSVPSDGRPWSSHDLRRSFAQNALLAGLLIPLILELGGWLTPSMLYRYAINDEGLLHRGSQRVCEYTAKLQQIADKKKKGEPVL